jgi:hypothetical protein
VVCRGLDRKQLCAPVNTKIDENCALLVLSIDSGLPTFRITFLSKKCLNPDNGGGMSA